MLRILNPAELPGDDWIKKGCWIYEEEKEILALKRAVKRIKAWGMRKEVPSCGKAPFCCKEISLWLPGSVAPHWVTDMWQDGCSVPAVLMLRYLSTVVATSLKEPWDQRAKFSTVLQPGGCNAWVLCFVAACTVNCSKPRWVNQLSAWCTALFILLCICWQLHYLLVAKY